MCNICLRFQHLCFSIVCLALAISRSSAYYSTSAASSFSYLFQVLDVCSTSRELRTRSELGLGAGDRGSSKGGGVNYQKSCTFHQLSSGLLYASISPRYTHANMSTLIHTHSLRSEYTYTYIHTHACNAEHAFRLPRLKSEKCVGFFFILWPIVFPPQAFHCVFFFTTFVCSVFFFFSSSSASSFSSLCCCCYFACCVSHFFGTCVQIEMPNWKFTTNPFDRVVN